MLATAHRALVIHGNYLAGDEIDFVAAHRERMSLVYCPRTHAYFGHEPYPLAEMLAAGVRVAVGTDSRASNPDLRLLKSCGTSRGIIRMFEPARSCGWARWRRRGARAGDKLGSLSSAGKRARLAVVPNLEAAIGELRYECAVWLGRGDM